MTGEIEKEKSVGERLLALRNKNSLTQEELADQLNVSRQSISKWELNKTLPDVEKLIQLSEMYGVSIDFLIKGEEETMETEPQDDNSEGQTMDIKDEEGAELEADGNRMERTIKRVVFTVCMLLSGLLCFCMLFVTGSLLFRQVFDRGSKEQDMAYVEKIYEQYTKAEVLRYSKENGGHQKEVVWLDVPGVRENDYVFCYLDGEKPDKASFEYYPKTILLPAIAGIIFLIFFIVFLMEFRELVNRKHDRGYTREK